MIIEGVVKSLYGKPCWNVKPGYGSFLTMEFGEPHLEIREPTVASATASPKVRKALAQRRVFVRGEWHLWIYCCDWRLFTGRKHIGDSSTKGNIARAAEFLDGQALTNFSISRRNARCVFDFDLGGRLVTQPYDNKSEQWMLFEPLHMVLVVRADGRYKHTRSDAPEDQGEWMPIRG